MIDYRAIAALAEVLRRGSFEAAADALGVTQPAISQRIKTLESRIGTVLIDRGPPVAATPAALRLIAHLDQVRLLEQGLEADIQPQDAPPTIRIAVNADSLATWACDPLVAAPGLVDLILDDQDHAESWLRGGLVSAAITASKSAVAGCDSFRLGTMRYLATASPEFVQRHFSGGVDADSLRRAPAVRFNPKDGLQDRWAAQYCGRRVAMDCHFLPSTQGFAQATRLGMGWGMNPEILIADDLKSGRLVPLVPDAPLDVTLYLQVVRLVAKPLAPLTRALRRAAQQALGQQPRA